MYTQCPDCQTRFRVTADALRAAHGTVRCGRCGSAFDALVRLSDTPPRAVPEVAPLPLLLASEDEFTSFVEPGVEPIVEAANESTAVFVHEGTAGEDITLEGERVQIEGAMEVSEEPAAAEEEVYDPDATDEFRLLEIPPSAYPDEQDAERELEALVLRLQREFGPLADAPAATPDAPDEPDEPTSEMHALDELESSTEAVSEPQIEPAREVAAVEEIVLPPEIALESERWAEPTPEPAPFVPVEEPATDAEPPPPLPPPAPIIVPVEERPLAARRWRPEPVELEQDAATPERSVWRTLAWSTGALLLVLALAAQVVHHFRRDLAEDARLGPPLRAAYARLGLPLPPAADLEALELRQLGGDEREAGRLVVRASLTNRARFDQPYPLLRLQFEDRFGSLIATRDFEPADYLTDPAQAARPMAPGTRSEAALVLADPGAEAVGYRLDVCVAESATMLRCARGPGNGP
jgi:predicted Zn finger-like uncharacterized protein